jgi:hypothetical protein
MELRGIAGQEAGEEYLVRSFTFFMLHTYMREASSHFEYLENRSHCLDVTRHPVRGDLTVHP